MKDIASWRARGWKEPIRMTLLNPYALKVQQYYQQFHPKVLQRMKDPDTFCNDQGQQIEEAIDHDWQARMDKVSSTSTGYQDQQAMLETLRREAEQAVLDRMLRNLPDILPIHS
jgi:hypothetical protein